MLVLTRKPFEVIVIRSPDGAELTVTCLEFRSGKVRIGITAPADWPIMRGELAETWIEPEKIGA